MQLPNLVVVGTQSSGKSSLLNRMLRFPILPVVMVSGAFDRAIVQEALAAGAAGFIPKSLKRSAIVDALHRVVSGEIYLPETMGEGAAPSADEDDITRRIDKNMNECHFLCH